jgi:hypothetical protein
VVDPERRRKQAPGRAAEPEITVDDVHQELRRRRANTHGPWEAGAVWITIRAWLVGSMRGDRESQQSARKDQNPAIRQDMPPFCC